MKVRSLLFVIGLLLLATATFAQSDRGTITGTVADATGAVIPGATIEAKNLGSGTVYTGGSSETGNYTLPQLPVGTYEVTVNLPGFKKFVRPSIVVGVAQIVRVDASLQVGANTESVTVEAAAPLLKTESGEVSHNINTDLLDSLPVLTLNAGGGGLRNPLQAINLIPGTSYSNDNTLRVNGMPSSTQAIRIDGQDATNGLWRQQNQISQPSIDALQEIAVQTGNYDAEYGQAGGGYFNYTPKSGTNQFHGAAYDYFVNEAFNGGTPFTDRCTAYNASGVCTAGDTTRPGQHVRNRQRRNEWGFNIGGPIMLGKLYDGHNKTFFFFNFDQFRESRSVANTFATVPTSAYRNGDFSTALGPQLTLLGAPAVDPLGRAVYQNEVFDPRTTRTAPDGSTVRDPFGGFNAAGRPVNIIPSSLFDPVALKVQGLMPQANTGVTNVNCPIEACTNNYLIPTYSNFTHTTVPSFKIDHNFDAKNRMSFYFSLNRQRQPAVNGFEQAWTTAAPTATNNYTYRIGYDRTVSPTKLLHIGVGYFYTFQPAGIPKYTFDQSTLGWRGNFYTNYFPNIGLTADANGRGGSSLGMGGTFGAYNKDLKPTANITYTWVSGNHSMKFGADLIVEGIQIQNISRSNGILSFGSSQTGIGTWENGRGLNSTTGFGYASFLLGLTSSETIAPLANFRMGNHSLAFYAQDSWKVTRKLTLNYGLRWDFVTLLREQYGRMQSANFTKPNPLLNGRIGAVDYEGDCGSKNSCAGGDHFNKNYPYAFGPRLSLAYQITPKTVLRAGAGIAYGSAPNNAYLSYSVNDFYTPSAPFSETFSQLSDGNIYAPGNRFGNPPAVFPDFTPHFPFEVSPGLRPPQSPFIFIDRHAGRPPRIAQWSFGLQRELNPNLLVEAAYVGNRGVWWSAPLLQDQAYNALKPSDLAAWGLDINNANDRNLLTTQVRNIAAAPGGAAFLARYPWVGQLTTVAGGNLVNNNVYPGFPATQTLNQILRPYPQWNGIPPFLGPPLGDTWYDSLQVKGTQRFSHNVTAGVSYTFAKELTNGANSDTSYLTPNPPLINDVFNRAQAKQLSTFGHPHSLVINFNYTTPKVFNDGNSAAMKVVNGVLHDWTIGGVLRYQSGDLIRVPASNNGLLTQLARGFANNPALWGGGNTFFIPVAGKPLFLKDPNCHCIDPTKDFVLNKDAWVDVAPGQFSQTAPYYNDYRWQRQPSEALSLGRNFRVAKESKVVLNVRAEAQNVFNRLFLASPSATNPVAIPGAPSTQVPNVGGLTSGFGFVTYTGLGQGSRPRSGQIVARLIF